MEQKLSKQRPQPDGGVLGELDAIVVKIFNSMSGRADERGGPPPQQPAVDPCEPPRQREPAPLRAGRTSTDPSPTREAAPRGVSSYPEDDAREDQDFLLNEEEEKFVERTVAWLNERPNPDILLDRIWNRLIDLTEDEEARLAADEDEGTTAPGESAEDEAGET